MARGNIVTGLDIGTHSIKALVAQKFKCVCPGGELGDGWG